MSAPSDSNDGSQFVAGIRALLAEAVTALESAGVPDTVVAEFVPARRVLGFTRRSRFVPTGRAWMLGVFLLQRDGTLFAAGATTRAVEPGYPGHQSQSAEQRREYRAAAFNGPFERGETVAFDAQPINLDPDALRASSGPLFIARDSVLVRWSRSVPDSSARHFDEYLRERVALAVDPPAGA